MRNLQYLETSKAGLTWMRAYYRKNPQLNRAKAVASLIHAENTLRERSYAGRAYEDSETVREIKLQNTAFSLLYTIANDTVWIIDVRDQRGLRSAEALRAFTRELRQKHKISLDFDE